MPEQSKIRKVWEWGRDFVVQSILQHVIPDTFWGKIISGVIAVITTAWTFLSPLKNLPGIVLFLIFLFILTCSLYLGREIPYQWNRLKEKRYAPSTLDQTLAQEQAPSKNASLPPNLPTEQKIPVTTFVHGNQKIEATYATISNTTHQTVISPGRVEIRKFPAVVIAGQSTAIQSTALEIKFEDIVHTEYYAWQEEMEGGRKVNVQRKSILLDNQHGRDLEKVCHP